MSSDSTTQTVAVADIVENKDESTQSTETASPKSPSSSDPPTKATYRKKVWSHLDQNRLVNFPWPVYGRIPNFKGSELAANKLQELEEFKNATNIEVNPDKAQEFARVATLEAQKKLFVPVPKLKNGLLKRITAPEGATKAEIRSFTNQKGIEMCNEVISVDADVKIDLMVVGSVAVSKDGHRIGKGRGYADLEFGILTELKSVNENTTIVTLVHDSQVFEELPQELFQDYDLPVDFIVTPTTIIQVPKRLPRPQGILWKVLSNRRLQLMPLVQTLRESSEKNGVDVTLKGEDTDIESYEPKPYFNNYRRRFTKRRSPSGGKTSDSQGEDTKVEKPRPKRFFKRYYRRPSRSQQNQENNHKPETGTSTSETKDAAPAAKPIAKFRRFRHSSSKRPKIDFSLMVSNIEKTVRVRDLKNALNERGIKPNEITWRGYRGFAYLHYAKPPVKQNMEPIPPFIVDNVIEILQNLKIYPESESSLSVKVMEPISRIETTDVTAV